MESLLEYFGRLLLVLNGKNTFATIISLLRWGDHNQWNKEQERIAERDEHCLDRKLKRKYGKTKELNTAEYEHNTWPV